MDDAFPASAPLDVIEKADSDQYYYDAHDFDVGCGHGSEANGHSETDDVEDWLTAQGEIEDEVSHLIKELDLDEESSRPWLTEAMELRWWGRKGVIASSLRISPDYGQQRSLRDLELLLKKLDAKKLADAKEAALQQQLAEISEPIPKDKARGNRRRLKWLKEGRGTGNNPEASRHRSSRSAIASLAIRSAETEVADVEDLERAEEIRLIRQRQIDSIAPEEVLERHNQLINEARRLMGLQKRITKLIESMGPEDQRFFTKITLGAGDNVEDLETVYHYAVDRAKTSSTLEIS